MDRHKKQAANRVFFRLALALLGLSVVSPPTASGQTYVFGRADFDAGGPVTAVATGDFNGDGREDLVVVDTYSNGGAVFVLLGKPDGTFAAPAYYAAGANASGVAVGDFNQDGKLDVITANHDDSTVSVLFGNGDGTFQTHADYHTASSPSFVAVGDFNGDGKIDLAVARQGRQTSRDSGLGYQSEGGASCAPSREACFPLSLFFGKQPMKNLI